ncbi:MAG: O-antigen/teichoic acid export membrane protein [Ilumatobacter sp.]|jgi:O-antigen/teichoic acid export membrane protein
MTGRRIVLAVAGAVFGYAVYGLVTAVIGAVLGFFTADQPHLASVTAASLVLAMGLFVITERTLDLASFGQFVTTRPWANWAGRLVAVAWVLAVLVGWADSRAPESDRNDRASIAPRAGRSTAGAAEVIAIVGGSAALLSLVLLGDRTWAWSAIPIVAGALVLLAARHLPKLLHTEFTAVMRFVPGRTAAPAADRPDEVMSGSVWMLGGTAVVSIGSFVFWIVAARTATQESVGAAAALFSVVTFLNYATSLGLPIALTRFARDDGRASSVLFTWTLVLTSLSSFVGVAVFAAVAPGSVTSAVGSTFGWTLLALNVAGLSLSVLVDVRCMTLRLWRWVFWRSFAISVIRLPFLFMVPDDDATLFLFNVVAGAYSVTGLVCLVWMIVKSKERLALRPTPRDRSIVARFATVNYLGQLAIQGPFFAVPLIVLTTLSAKDNASFYLAWGIMSVVVISVQIIGQVLLVEGDRGRDLVGQARVALSVSLGVGVVSLAGVVILGSFIRGVYGTGYEDVPTLLVILVAGTVPYAVTVVGLSYARVKSDSRATIIITFAFAALVLVPALLLTDGHGAIGAAWAWLVGNCASALVVALSHPGHVAASLRLMGADRSSPPDDEPGQSSVDASTRRMAEARKASEPDRTQTPNDEILEEPRHVHRLSRNVAQARETTDVGASVDRQGADSAEVLPGAGEPQRANHRERNEK